MNEDRYKQARILLWQPNEFKDESSSAMTLSNATHSTTLGRSASCAGTTTSGDIMSEMARRLRERRAKAEGNVSVSN